MKINLTLFLFFLFSISWADDNCEINASSADSLFDFYKTKCGDKKGKSLCECLKEQKKSNAFIKSAFESETDMQVSKETYTKNQTHRLMKVYKQMTYGAAYQKKFLNIDLKPVVGCSSEQLSKVYEESIRNHSVGELSRQKAQALANGCKNNSCKVLQNTVAKIDDEMKNIEAKVQMKCSELSRVISASKPNADSFLVKDLKIMEEWYKLNKPNSDKLPEIQKTISRLLGTYKFEGLSSKINFIIDKRNVMDSSSEECDIGSSSYTELMTDFKDELVKAKVDIESVLNRSATDNLVKSIDNFNKQVEEEFSKSFDLVAPHACYTYSEYQILKSKPSQFLLDALNGIATSEDLNDFFTPTANFTNQLDLEKMKFLRGNPALANTQTVKCAKHELPLLLKQFAADTKGMTEAGKMKAYIAFMQTEGKSLLNADEVKQGEIANCEMLGRNIAGVFLTDEPGPVPEFNSKNPFQMLGQQILTCKISDKQKDSKSNLEFTLNSNPLYLIKSDDIAAHSDSSKDMSYQEFLDKNCKDYETFHKKYVQQACKDPATSTTCQEKLKTTAGTEELRASYFKGNQDSSLKVAINSNTNTVLRSRDHEDVASTNQEKMQDQLQRIQYDKEVRPRMGNTILASKGNEVAYTNELAKNREVIAESASKFLAPAIPVAPVVAEPNWKIPQFPVVTPETLTEARPKALLPVDYPVQSPVEKLETLKEARKHVQQSGEKLISEANSDADKDKILKDLRKSIENMDKETAKIQKLAANQGLPSKENKSSVSNSSGSSSTGPSGAGANFTSGVSQNGGVSSSSNRRAEGTEKPKESKYGGSEKSSVDRKPANIQKENVSIVIGTPRTEALEPNAVLLSHVALDAGSFGDKNIIMDKVKSELEKKKVQSHEKVLIQFFDSAKNEVLIVDVAWKNDQWVVSQVPRKALLANLNLTMIDLVK